MPIRGSFDEMPPSEVVQHMHVSGKTGTLYLFGTHGAASLVFAGGTIVSATHPDRDVRIATALRESGDVDAAQIEAAMGRQRQAAARRLPLSVTLVEMGHLTRDQCRQALESVALRTLAEVITWRTGTFLFDAGELEGEDGFRYGEVALRLQGKLHTEELLMEATRLVDERRRAERGAAATGSIPATRIDLPELPEPAAPTPSTQMRVLHQAVRSLHRGMTPDDAAPAILELAASCVQRGVLFTVSGPLLRSLGSFGFPSSGSRALPAGFEMAAIPALGAGGAEGSYPSASLHTFVGTPRSGVVAWLPVEIGGRNVLALYGDMGESDAVPDGLEALEILVAYLQELFASSSSGEWDESLFVSEIAS